jgi:predicted metal-dependent phosphoesterase TrpH
MRGTVDLHCHTTASDGALSPRELLLRAKKAGLTTVGITDHDHVGAVDEATHAGRELGITVVPGVELSTNFHGIEIHLLGYFVNHRNPALVQHLAFLRAERLKRAERIIGKLNDLRIPLRLESVLEQAGEGSVGRPHIASALVEEGLTETYHEAFLKYIGAGKPAYEQHYQVSPQQAAQVIASAGGLSFIAHPGKTLDEQTLLALLRSGIDGIEVIHPSHTPERVAYYRGIVSEYFLLASGGSDFHGGRRNDDDVLGTYVVNEDTVAMMRRRLHL